jgi:hypothetical protein
MADQDWLVEDMRATITDLMVLARAQFDELQDLRGGRKPPPSNDAVVFLAPR